MRDRASSRREQHRIARNYMRGERIPFQPWLPRTSSRTFIAPDGQEGTVSALSWLWTALLGPLYLLARGLKTHSALLLILDLAFLSAGLTAILLPNLLYGLFVPLLLRQHYLKLGWRPAD